MLPEELPEGWAQISLSAVTKLSKEKWEPSGADEDHRYLSLEHIESDTGRIVGCGSSNEVRSTKAIFEAGDVLYGKLRPYLNKVAQPDFAGVCSTDILVFKPSGVIDNDLLRYLLSTRDVVDYASHNSNGINLPRISASKLGEYEVALPPLAEQRRIVAKLDALEERRRAIKARLDRLPGLLERYRQSVLAAAFRGDLTVGWRQRHPDTEPAEVLLEKIRAERRRRWVEAEAEKATQRAEACADKQGHPWDEATRAARLAQERTKAEKKYRAPEPVDATDLPDLPDGWCWASVEEMTALDRPVCYGVVQPGSEIAGGVPLIRVCDLIDGRVDVDQLRTISPSIDDQYIRSRVLSGDVLVSLVGTIGRIAVVDEPAEGANIARALARLERVMNLGS